jgi:hypothetical protein
MPEAAAAAAECRAMGASKKQDSFFALRSFIFQLKIKNWTVFLNERPAPLHTAFPD